MNPKLDPRLAEIVSRSRSRRRGRDSAPATVDVLVGLDVPLDESTRADLIARGLRLRSEIGTVLTGNVSLGDVAKLADSPHVTKIEASAPMYREPTNDGGVTE
jgi:hypothetical protein